MASYGDGYITFVFGEKDFNNLKEICERLKKSKEKELGLQLNTILDKVEIEKTD